jgi:hypothetical protein
MRSNGKRAAPSSGLTAVVRRAYPGSVVERKEGAFMKVQFDISLRLDPTSS